MLPQFLMLWLTGSAIMTALLTAVAAAGSRKE